MPSAAARAPVLQTPIVYFACLWSFRPSLATYANYFRVADFIVGFPRENFIPLKGPSLKPDQIRSEVMIAF